MALREPKQSLLDYLWSNFGKLSVPKEITEGTLITSEEVNAKLEVIDNLSVSTLSMEGLKLIGRNSDGNKITEVLIPSLSGGLIQGSESDSLVLDITNNIISGRLKLNNKDSLITLIETNSGLRAEFNGDLSKQLEIIQSVAEDLESIKSDLQILKGDENQEGSVLNLINSNIKSAFEWQEIY